MSRAIKITTVILSLLLLLFVVGAMALLTFVDPNGFKDPIIHQIEKATGRQVTIKGDLSWSFLPKLGISIEDVVVANPADFRKKAFLEISSLDVRVKILPLLKKHMALGKIILHEPTFNLMRNAQGKTNWAFKTKTPSITTPAITKSSSYSSTHTPITMDGLKITSAVIHWDDDLNQQSMTVTIPSLQLKNFTEGQPTHIRFTFKTENNQPHWVAQGKINSTVLLSPYDIEILGLTYTSKATGDSDDLRSVEVNFQTDKLTYNWKTRALNTGNLQGNLANMPFTALLKGTLGPHPTLKGNLRIPTFNLPKWLASFDITNPLQQDQASANLTLALQEHGWKLAPLSMSLDKMRMQGAVDYDNNQHVLNVDLKANTLNLNELKKQKKTKAMEKAKALLTQKKTKPTLNTMGEWLQRYTLKGQVDVDNILIGSVMAQHVHTALQGGKKQIQLTTSANFYQGLMKSTLVADFNNNQPQYRLQENVQNVQIQPLLQAFNIKNAPTGIGSLNATLNSQGNKLMEVQERLNGSLNFRVMNGTIKGLNLVKLLNQAAEVALKDGKLISGNFPENPSSSEENGTAFSSVTANWSIKQGVASNNDLLFQSPLMNGRGHGTINVVDGALYYYLAIQTIADQLPAVEQLQKLIGGTIKIKFGCTIMKPCPQLKLSIDPNKLIKTVDDLLTADGKKPLKNPLKNIKLPSLFN